MAENTEISWCDHTLNLWWGCTEVHAGCDNCYAKTLATRWGFDVWGAPGSKGGVRRVIQSAWKDLDRYQRNAAKDGVSRTVFVGSMMDIFEKPMPLVNIEGDALYLESAPYPNMRADTGHLRNRFFHEISEGKYPNLLFLLLTKRPSNINKYIPESWRTDGAPDNVMFGTSVVNQETADKLIPQLLEVKGKRFLSCEPLLGPVNLDRSTAYYSEDDLPDFQPWLNKIDWVIVGGESGHKARPMHPEWAQSIQMQCAEAGVKFHFKQWGEWHPMGQTLANGSINCMDKQERAGVWHEPSLSVKVGKKAAGRLLDGKEYNALATD